MIPSLRIIVFDPDRYDRGLLCLALRTAQPEFDVVKTASLLELMHELSSSPPAAVVCDPGSDFDALCEIIDFARQRGPDFLFWLFTGSADLPTVQQCQGRGVDGRDCKDSAGYLEIPQRLLARVQCAHDCQSRFPEEMAILQGSAMVGAAGLIDRAGNFQVVNRALEHLLETPRYELLSAALSALTSTSAAQNEIAERLQGPRAPWTLVTGGHTQELALAVKPVGSATRQAAWWSLSVVGLGPPATAPVATELDSRKEELEQMLFAVTHDLQAPLNSLGSNARWLATQTAHPDAEVAEAVNEMAGLAARMQQMLDGILSLATVRAGSHEPEVVSLDSVLNDALANLRSDIEDTGARIERQPLPTLLVNRQHMVQVFQNLLSNALKFRGPPPPRVRISSQDSGECLRIVIEDNGTGIDPADTGRIFGMFKRLHTEREYPGLGVGLAICQQVVRAHGGELFVESALGHGASFVMEFRGPGLRSVINPPVRDGVGAR